MMPYILCCNKAIFLENGEIKFDGSVRDAMKFRDSYWKNVEICVLPNKDYKISQALEALLLRKDW